MRKFRATEISGNVNVDSNGQHMKANWFCVNCNGIGTHEKHYPDCRKHEAYAIQPLKPQSEILLRKNGTSLKSNLYFLSRLCYGEYSWWAKNKNNVSRN